MDILHRNTVNIVDKSQLYTQFNLFKFLYRQPYAVCLGFKTHPKVPKFWNMLLVMDLAV